MDATRTEWSDLRLDGLADRTKYDVNHLDERVERLREEIGDLRKEDRERRQRRTEVVMNAMLGAMWALLIANIVLAAVAPE
jgi:hypothetical protein